MEQQADFIEEIYKLKEATNFQDFNIDKEYFQFYEDIKLETLKSLFTYLHYELNNSFSIINNENIIQAKISSNTLKLFETLDALQLITQQSKYSFEINKTYFDAIKSCRNFLNKTISLKIDSFKTIKIINDKSIFTFNNTISIEKASYNIKIFFKEHWLMGGFTTLGLILTIYSLVK